MITTQSVPFRCLLQEQMGLAHERQILEIEAPPVAVPSLRDRDTGRLFPFQRSQADARRGFLLVGLEPLQRLDLEPCEDAAPLANPIEVRVGPDEATVQNGLWALRVPVGAWQGGGASEMVPGPLNSFQLAGDKARGRTFLDVRAPVASRRGWMDEQGPLRAVACYRVELAGGGFYESRIGLDAAQTVASFAEQWSAGASDQMVWDFSGEDFPAEMLLLDATPGYTSRKIQPHFDQRHARLWGWTQQSQLHDLRDGFALKFDAAADAPVAGFLTLNGGQWRGNRTNHLEAWTRRWWREDPLSRRGQGWENKADSLPAPDAIPRRGESVGTPHFNLEGALAEEGSRAFLLVLTRASAAMPPRLRDGGDERGCSQRPGHFDDTPDRAQYALEQSLLRRLHIQRGLFSLREVLAIDASPEAGQTAFAPERTGYLHPIVEAHFRHLEAQTLEARKAWLFDYLAARVFGFWEGGGLAATNPVSSRDLAPALFLFEYLTAQGDLTPDEEAQCRRHFLFLATLFFSDNCYPGDATMLPLGSADGVEPTLAGMANQNFFTDVFNTYGLAALIFPQHPAAAAWNAAFGRHWERQLAYHTYPESGLWEESHTYYQHVLHTILPTCLRRRDDGIADDFANPRFQNMVRSALLQITPPDAACGGARHLVAFGDHHADVETYASLYRELAHAFGAQNPQLAAELAWLYQEMGGRDALHIEPRALQWASGPVQGLGYFFRTTTSDGTQNLLALRCGGAWGHHHHDETSLQFFAGGRALIVDAAFGHSPENPERKFLASGHSRWSLAAQEPFNFFWRFNRGWIEEAQAGGRFPFAVARNPVVMVARAVAEPHALAEPITHWRRVVQLAAGAFLVIDESDTELPQIARFHVPLTDFQLHDGLLQADYPAAANAEALTLHIANGSGVAPVPGETDLPGKAGMAHFATREIRFPISHRAVHLLYAHAPGSPFSVRDGLFTGETWQVQLTWPDHNAGQWRLDDKLAPGALEWPARARPLRGE